MDMDCTNVPDTRGWQVGKSLAECFGQLLDDQSMCDVKFKIRNQKGKINIIPAHKLILSTRSPVFEAMFSGNFVESHTDVEIVDSDWLIFNEMLRYIYSEKVQISGNNVLQLLNLARKYILEGLADICKQFIDNELCDDNVCDILSHSMQFGEDDLATRCTDYAWSRAREVIQTSSFRKMSQPALLQFLKCDRAGTVLETDILDACLEWAKFNAADPSETDPRATLGDCIYQIQFSYLSAEQFTARLGDSALLTSDEKCVFLCLLTSNDEKYRQQLQEFGFNLKELLCEVSFGTRYLLPAVYIGKYGRQQEILAILPKIPLLLKEFGFFGGSSMTETTVTIHIQCPQEGGNVVTVNERVVIDGSDKLYKIPVPGNKRLQPNNQYIVNITSTTGAVVQNISNEQQLTNGSDLLCIIRRTRQLPVQRGVSGITGHVARIAFQRV